MDRRALVLRTLAALAALPGSAVLAQSAGAGSSNAVVGGAWRGPGKNDPHYAGALELDWNHGAVRVRYQVELPTRPHGLAAQPDGGLLVIGVRPGDWLLRCDGAGKVVTQVRVDEEPGKARLNGHSAQAAGGAVVFTTETDMASGRGRIGVRDVRTLRKLDEWDSLGIEPHQLLPDAEGHLFVANGGIPRTAGDRKYELERMDSSLVRLDSRTGRPLGQWRLDDPRLSLRHLAWNAGPSGAMTRLGVAMQAEHDEPERRDRAPVLAVWEDGVLGVPTFSADGAGYAGDIAPAADGGFVVSSNKAGRALLWRPRQPQQLTTIANLREPYALAGWGGPGNLGGVLIAAALGAARWHPSAAPTMAPWPQPMALDNHWVLVSAA